MLVQQHNDITASPSTTTNTTTTTTTSLNNNDNSSSLETHYLSNNSSSNSTITDQLFLIERNEFTIPLYGYATPFFVFLTLTTNCLVCAVLIRKPMRTCTNMVLFSLAVSDAMTGLWPLPCFVYFYTFNNYKDYLTYDWCFIFFCFTDYLPTAFHTASVWLTVLLAAQRYLYVCHPVVARRICTLKRTFRTVATVYVTALATQFCRFVDGQFTPVSVPSLLDQSKNITACIYVFYPLIENYLNIYFGIFYWFRVLFVHIIPCLGLVLLNARLVQVIRTAQIRRKFLLNGRKSKSENQQSLAGCEMKDLINFSNKELGDVEVTNFSKRKVERKLPSDINCLSAENPLTAHQILKEQQLENNPLINKDVNSLVGMENKVKSKMALNERRTRFNLNSTRPTENHSTTLMLVVVVGIFLLVELPLAILFILNFVDNTWNQELLPKHLSYSASLFINILTLMSYSCNFFVYCAMSHQFRQNFKALFDCRKKRKKLGFFQSKNSRRRSSHQIRSSFVGHISANENYALVPSRDEHLQKNEGRIIEINTGLKSFKNSSSSVGDEIFVVENKNRSESTCMVANDVNKCCMSLSVDRLNGHSMRLHSPPYSLVDSNRFSAGDSPCLFRSPVKASDELCKHFSRDLDRHATLNFDLEFERHRRRQKRVWSGGWKRLRYASDVIFVSKTTPSKTHQSR